MESARMSTNALQMVASTDLFAVLTRSVRTFLVRPILASTTDPVMYHSGSYRCVCKQGFKPAGKACVDVNECEEIPNICSHDCTNLWGSYRCHCREGYKLSTDSRSCVDIDECEEAHRCMGQCYNEPGSYRCSCPTGYKISANGLSCEDVDECAVQSPCQGRNSQCHNTRGSYKCLDVKVNRRSLTSSSEISLAVSCWLPARELSEQQMQEDQHEVQVLGLPVSQEAGVHFLQCDVSHIKPPGGQARPGSVHHAERQGDHVM